MKYFLNIVIKFFLIFVFYFISFIISLYKFISFIFYPFVGWLLSIENYRKIVLIILLEKFQFFLLNLFIRYKIFHVVTEYKGIESEIILPINEYINFFSLSQVRLEFYQTTFSFRRFFLHLVLALIINFSKLIYYLFFKLFLNKYLLRLSLVSFLLLFNILDHYFLWCSPEILEIKIFD